jgi:hypothetical protein
MRLASIVFGMVQSNRIAVVSLHKLFSTWLSSSCNSISIIMNFTFTTVSELTILVCVTNSNLAYYV